MMLVRLAGIFFSALLFSACSKEPLYQEEAFVFGTRVEISVYAAEEAKAKLAVSSVMQEFQRLHNKLHAWKPSELSELNTAIAHGKSAKISIELKDILSDATQLSVQSDSLFNPAIGGLVKLWGFHAEEYKPALPEAKKLETLVSAKPMMSNISLKLVADKKVARYEASSNNRKVSLDLGGYAKGYALDRAVALLKQQGISNALINIGGNVIAIGSHGSRPWRVGIQHPRKPGPLATLDLHDGEAIGTSGDYQRYFEIDGKRYCHLLDPRTGHPAQGVQAVTVLTHGPRAGVLSDAASKPLFIVGATAWRAAADKMQLQEALLIDDAGTLHLTAAMQKRLEFSDKNVVMKLSYY